MIVVPNRQVGRLTRTHSRARARRSLNNLSSLRVFAPRQTERRIRGIFGGGMVMTRWHVVAGVLVVAGLVGLVGCGAGGSGAGNGAVAPLGVSAAPAQQVFVLDFVRHTVRTVLQKAGGVAQAQFVERNPGQAAAALALALTFYSADTGSPGQQALLATVTNNTPGTVGGAPDPVGGGIDHGHRPVLCQRRL